ncbi:OmpH family outer membrane protein [Mucilaginibacter sp.]|uniref:OmpH family outer membrane protein n=1 Tax=Mucilaginibacter sp. TaxID=1882438 RepID=UPI0035BC7282
MKIRTSIVAKSVLILSIAAGVAACNQNKSETKPAAAAVTTTEVAGKQDVVFFNQDSVVSQYEYIKDMDKRLETKGKAAQNDVNGREQAFQREVGEYQKSAATLSADQRTPIEQKLQRKAQELQTYKQNAGVQVQNDQVAEQTKLYEKLVDFTKAYAKEKGYKMVLTFKKGDPTMLYGDPSLDITADVVKRLNEAYAKDKK